MTTYTWVGMSANWTSTLFWTVNGVSNGSVPGSGDIAIVAASGTYSIAAQGVAVQSVTLSDPSATLMVSGTGFTAGSGGLGGLANVGTIAVGAGSVLQIGSAGGGSFSNTGQITLGSGAVMKVLANATSNAFAQVTSNGGTVVLQDTLDNTGATLATANLGTLKLQGLVTGGTIADTGGVVIASLAAGFSNVALLGNFTFAGTGQGVSLDATSSLAPLTPASTATLTLASGLFTDANIGVLDYVVFQLSGTGAPIAMLAGTLGAAASLMGGGGTVAASLSLAANLGQIASGGGTLVLASGLANTGTITANGGSILADGAITGGGVIALSTRGTMELENSYGQQLVQFLDNTGLLKLDFPAGSSPTTVQGFGSGTTIELVGNPAPTLTITGTSQAGTTLVASNGSLTLATFVLPGLPANTTLVGTIDTANDTIITAKLAGSAGTYIWSPVGGSTDWTNQANWTGNSGFSTPGAQVSAPARDHAIVASGTVAYAPTLLNNVELTLSDSKGDNPEIDFGNVELGTNVVIDTSASNSMGTLKFSGQATLDAGAVINVSSGALTIDLAVDPANTLTPPMLLNNTTVAGLLSVVNVGTASGTLVNDGTLSKAFTLATAVTGTGVMSGVPGGLMTLLGPVGVGQTINLGDVNYNTSPSNPQIHGGELEIGSLAQFSGLVELSQYGEIRLDGIGASEVSYSNDVLTLSDGLTLRLTAPSTPIVTNNGTVTTVTDTVYPNCFAAGTMIATTDGEIAVERLSIGRHVRLAEGGTAPVVWLGHRRVDCTRHPLPADVWPIRIQANAFGPGRPHADLWLSPDHAVFVDGVLIPVRYLANGASVRQEPRGSITYFHVELPAHGVLLAQGLPAESYLDTGNRAAFANGGVVAMATPDFARRVWAADSVAPLVLEGPLLDAARAALLDRCPALGHRLDRDAAIRVLTLSGEILPVTRAGARRHVALPPETHTVRIVSRRFVPALARVGDRDHRVLGVAIGRMSIDFRDVGPNDWRLGDGWHAPEAAWRWTGGDAVVAVHRNLSFEVMQSGEYWNDAPMAA